MSDSPTLGHLLESFFRGRLVEQRNVTLAGYHDALRLFIVYAAKRAAREPCKLDIADLDRDTVLDFFNYLERNRHNGVRTRNARLTAIRSFYQHVAASDPGSLGIAQRVMAIPSKRASTPAPKHLTEGEVDVLLDAPDQHNARGRRDRTLLLFLVRTGARVSEALGVDVANFYLQSPAQVLLRGKGRKQRVVALACIISKASPSAASASLSRFISTHAVTNA